MALWISTLRTTHTYSTISEQYITRWVQDILKRCEVQPKEDGDSFPETPLHTRNSENANVCNRYCFWSVITVSGLVSPSRTRYPYLVVAGDGKDVSRCEGGFVSTSMSLCLEESPLTQQQQQPDRLASVVASFEWPSRGPSRKAEKLFRKSEGYDINDSNDINDQCISTEHILLFKIISYPYYIFKMTSISCNFMNFHGIWHSKVRFNIFF